LLGALQIYAVSKHSKRDGAKSLVVWCRHPLQMSSAGNAGFNIGSAL